MLHGITSRCSSEGTYAAVWVGFPRAYCCIWMENGIDGIRQKVCLGAEG